MKILILGNGFAYNILGAVGETLGNHGHSGVSYLGPIRRDEGRRRLIRKFDEKGITEATRRSMIGYPLSMVFDPVFPMKFGTWDVVVSFNPATTMRALSEKKLQRVERVVHWTVDYSPERFISRAMNLAYHEMERQALKHSDLHVDISSAASEARYKSHGLEPIPEQHMVIPVGIRTSLMSNPSDGSWQGKRVAFLGTLHPRQGADIAIQSIAEVGNQSINLSVIGDGSELTALQNLANSLGLQKRVVFHGYRSDEEIRFILSECLLGLSPYVKDPKSLSNYSDPSKIKQYITHGLPCITSNVPPIASLLAHSGAGVIADPTPRGFAIAIESLLESHDSWKAAHIRTAQLRSKLAWPIVLSPFLNWIGT